MKRSVLPSRLNRKIGQAMSDWKMLNDGDRVRIGVSGGVDSLVTSWILSKWREKAPIHYDIETIYVDNGFWTPECGGESPAEKIGRQMQQFSIEFSVVRGWSLKDGEDRSCFVCARNRRSQLFELARQKDCNKLALGHHKDDLVETFFINALYSGNISTMLPYQELFEGNLNVIRIMSYLEKKEVLELSELVGLVPVENLCPLAGDTSGKQFERYFKIFTKKFPTPKIPCFQPWATSVRDICYRFTMVSV